MRKLIFCAVVALSCTAASSSFAQVRMLQSGPTPAPRLVAAQAEIDSSLPFVPQREEIPNPFDFGNDNTPPIRQPMINQAAPAPPVIDDSADGTDPTSLPVGRHHRRRNNVVDTMANYGAVASIPNAAMGHIDWCYGAARTPNPVAEILLHEDCVAGLWDGYPAQRAAECTQMWTKLTATKRCHSCSAGCNSGNCTTGGCATGHCGAGVNRYTQSGGCDTCTSCASASGDLLR